MRKINIILSMVFATYSWAVGSSGAYIVNSSKCQIVLAENQSESLSRLTFPYVINPGSAERFDIQFPTGYFSSHYLNLIYDVLCDDSPDAGILRVIMFENEPTTAGVCVYNNELAMDPGWSPREGVSCGVLQDEAGGAYTLRVRPQ